MPQGNSQLRLVGAASSGYNLRSVRYTPLANALGNAQLQRQMGIMAQAVQQINLSNRRQNTASAYDPKADEWDAFCSHYASGEQLATRYTVTSDKLYAFLCYQAFRNQRKRGGGKRQSDGSRPKAEFDPQEFEGIFTRYGAAVNSMDGEPIPDPEKPVGYDTVHTYKCVARNIWLSQVSRGANLFSWDLIYDARCRELLSMVKSRRQRIRRANFEEKLDHEFTPFTSLDQVGQVESWIWNHGKHSTRQSLAAFRN